MADPRTLATYTTYLFQGFNDQRDIMLVNCRPDGNTIFDAHADVHGGEVGIVMDLYYAACVVEAYISSLEAVNPELWDRGPGVIEYELISELGRWLFEHPEDFGDSVTSMCSFASYMKPLVHTWFYPPGAPAPQLESTTMKLSQLIEQLRELYNVSGNVDVLTRGSQPHKMVDAIEARVVKTSRRTAVFIGKPKAETEAD